MFSKLSDHEAAEVSSRVVVALYMMVVGLVMLSLLWPPAVAILVILAAILVLLP